MPIYIDTCVTVLTPKGFSKESLSNFSIVRDAVLDPFVFIIVSDLIIKITIPWHESLSLNSYLVSEGKMFFIMTFSNRIANNL